MIDERKIQPNVSQAYNNLSDYWILSHGENGGITVSDAANYLGLTEQAVRSLCRTCSEFYAEDTQSGWLIDPRGLVACKFIRGERKKRSLYSRMYSAVWYEDYIAAMQMRWIDDDTILQLATCSDPASIVYEQTKDYIVYKQTEDYQEDYPAVWYKALRSHGCSIEFVRQGESIVCGWRGIGVKHDNG